MSLPPWHLWGRSSSIHIDRSPPKGVADKSPQLVQVDYKRPETWRLFAWAKISNTNTAGATDLIVNFNITMGIGLAMVTFAVPAFRFSGGAGLPVGGLKYATEFRGPDRDDTEAAGDPNLITLLPTQIFIVQADLNLSAANAGEFCDVDVGFFVAPNAHIRPEWHAGRFTGGEAG
jgi:hypothetical protein